MALTRIHLASGWTAERAVEVLGTLILEGGNVPARNTGTGIGPGAEPLARAYVQWADRVEVQLSSMAVEPSLAMALQTGRYWHIRQLHHEPIEPFRLVQQELDQQIAWLEAMRDDLQARVRRALAAPGVAAIIDTNVLLEFVPPEQVNWQAVTGCEQVRLVVPLRVIEELDMHKYNRRRAELAERARAAIRRIERWVGVAGAPVEFRPATTIEVWLEDAPRERPADADEEILTVCGELEALAGMSKLLTGDMAMRLRAQGLGLDVVPMPDLYARQTGQVT